MIGNVHRPTRKKTAEQTLTLKNGGIARPPRLRRGIAILVLRPRPPPHEPRRYFCVCTARNRPLPA
ncbi:MAG: hypothetical protein Kow0059_04920 [Candidatus Sumerlaeia bacterium]